MKYPAQDRNTQVASVFSVVESQSQQYPAQQECIPEGWEGLCAHYAFQLCLVAGYPTVAQP